MKRKQNRRKEMGGAILVFTAALGLALGASAQETTQPPPPPVTALEALTLSGYAQVQYTTQSAGIDGFTLRRARLTLAGEILKNLTFKFQVDTLKSPLLLDAYLDWKFHSAASVRAGQFKIPFSMESLTSSADLDMINRTQVVSKLAPGWDIGSNGRDIGISLYGKAAFLDYTIAVFNGAGINKTDGDDKKDWAGRLVIHPASFLTLAVSGYDGKTVPSVGAAPVTRARVGLESSVLLDALSLKGEFIQGQDGDTMKQGWYAQGGYFVLPKQLQGLVRFDSYDPNRNSPLDRTDVWTLGVNWFLAARTKLTVNCEITRDESGKTTNKALIAQFQAAF
jgi:phosphate-selective porin